WIRLLYVYPASIKESLLNVIAGEDKMCKYLDIPLQHSEDRVLRLMRRKGSRKEYLDIIKNIRHFIPDIVLRTTFITGFPSETEEEFESLINFIDEVRFDRLGVFKYSKEDGTQASKLKGQIPEAVKDMRFDKIMSRQSRISLEKNKRLIGKRFKAMIDEIGNGTAIGRLYSHAPEIDGVVIITMHDTGYTIHDKKHESCIMHRASPSVRVGDFVNVEITDAFDYDLKGIIVE
ncbi:MAG: radical SAM protein, partial [Nitrospirae bacterium]|nr:radical SAM protein [Nitrospirota bacterium]